MSKTYFEILAQTEIDVARVHRVGGIFAAELDALTADWWAITAEMDALVDRFDADSHARWLELQAKRSANHSRAAELAKLQKAVLQAL